MLQTLGNTAISLSGVARAIRPREAALLAYLCLSEGRPLRTELAQLLWPHKELGRALRSLSQLLYETSRAFPELPLQSNRHAVWIEDIEIDVVHLQRLVTEGSYNAALTLYTGPFLDHELRSSTLMEWRDEVDSRVTSLIVECLDRVLSRDSVEHLDGVIRIAQMILRHRPYDVSVATNLIVALVRDAREREAQETYNKLTAELGTDVLPPFGLYLANESQFSRKGSDVEEMSSIPFVGRLEEVESLKSAWADVSGGRGRTIIIAGEPGIGKTRLAMQLMRRVAIAGGRAWIARCSEVTQRLPYSIAAELAHDMIDADSRDGGYLDDPELGFLIAGRPVTPDYISHQPSDEWMHRIVQRLTALVLTRCSEQALAILIDDAQWVDNFTGLLIRYWSYRLRSYPVMLILTVRTEDPQGAPNWIYSELANAKHFRLGRLCEKDAVDLVTAFEKQRGVTLHPDQRGVAIWQSAGQPYLLIEAMTSIIQGEESTARRDTSAVVLPASAEVLLRRRFATLSVEALWVSGFIALFGRPLDALKLASVSGLQAETVAVVLESLLARGIVNWDGTGIVYSHDLMRETATRQLAPTTRALIHGKIAAAIAEEHGAPGLLARHYAGAGDRVNAGEWSLKAGRQALRNHLYSDCEYYLRLAMSNGSDMASSEAARELVRLLLKLGRTAEADELFPVMRARFSSDETALLEAIAAVDRQLATGAVPIHEILASVGTNREIADFLQTADLAPIAGALLDLALDSSEAELGSELAVALTAAGDLSDNLEFKLQIAAMRAVWEALTLSVACGTDRVSHLDALLEASTSAGTRAIVLSAQGTVALLQGEIGVARSLLERAGPLAEAAGDLRRQMVIRLNEGVVFLEMGEFEEARKSFETVAAAQNVHYRVRAYANLSILHYEQHDYLLASKAADAVTTANSLYRSEIFERLAYAIKGLAAMRAGNWGSMLRYGDMLGSLPLAHHTMLDEDSYVVAFAAHLLRLDDRIDEAILRIDSALALMHAKSIPSRLRLECEKAEILSALDPDRAYATARNVYVTADRLGAIAIRNRAQRTITACRIQH